MHGVKLPEGVVMGDPGTRYRNTTDKVLWQLRVSFHNSCAICIQYANAVGVWFGIPYHYGCNCRLEPVPPGEQAEPFLDFMAEVEALPESERKRVVGAGNWRLVEAGKVQWTDVVTRSRIRPLHEVAERARLSERQLVDAGISRRSAREAVALVQTPQKQAVDAASRAAYQQLKALGLTDADIVSALRGRIAGRVMVVGPSGASHGNLALKTGPPKPPPAPPKPAVPAVPMRPKPTPKPIPESGAKVEFPAGDEAEAMAVAKRLFGREVSPRQIAAVAGAPEDAEVLVFRRKVGGRDAVEVKVNSAEAYLYRRIVAAETPDARSREIDNASFLLAGETGAGAGTRIFARQVEAASAAGFERITAIAERDDAAGYNGYYTWPRLGYDADLPVAVLRTLPPGLKGARRLSDLMETAEGRTFWKKEGVRLRVTFDLRAGSRSRRVLDAYLKARGIEP